MAAVLSSSESGSSSAASHAKPSSSFDLAPGNQSDSQNSISQSPSVLIGMHPIQIRSVEGGPMEDDPHQLEESSGKYATTKDSVDLPTHNDSDPEMELFKGQSHSEAAYGLIQGPFLVPDEHESNSRSNVSTPVSDVFILNNYFSVRMIFSF